MADRGLLILFFSGPSGVGKERLEERFFEEF